VVAEIAQLAEEIAGGLVTLLGFLGEAAVDGPAERGGELFFQRGGSSRTMAAIVSTALGRAKAFLPAAIS